MGPNCGMIWRSLAPSDKVEPPQGDKTRKSRRMGTSVLSAVQPRQRASCWISPDRDRETIGAPAGDIRQCSGNFRMASSRKQGLGTTNCASGIRISSSPATRDFCPVYEHRPALDEVVQMMSG